MFGLAGYWHFDLYYQRSLIEYGNNNNNNYNFNNNDSNDYYND